MFYTYNDQRKEAAKLLDKDDKLMALVTIRHSHVRLIQQLKDTIKKNEQSLPYITEDFAKGYTEFLIHGDKMSLVQQEMELEELNKDIRRLVNQICVSGSSEDLASNNRNKRP